jgi:hypothetical protein
MNFDNSQVSVSAFTSTENKGLLWSVLHGGGKFNGIPDTALKSVQVMFETTIHEMNETFQKMNQPVDLNVMNKEAVYVICKKLNALVNSDIRNPFPLEQKKQQQIPQLETIYRAEDIQKERQSVFNMELKKKEEEMSSIIKLRKPDEIKFSDDNYDKPIGDDMERLLAETLASRERELEQITKGKEEKDIAEKWIYPNSAVTAVNSKNNDVDADKKKKVSFNTIKIEHEHVGEYDEQHERERPAPTATPMTSAAYSTQTITPTPTPTPTPTLELNNLLNKFKKINNTTTNTNTQINSQNNNVIIQISEDIAFIKKGITELLQIMSVMSGSREKLTS